MDFSNQILYSLQLCVCSVFALNYIDDDHFGFQNHWTMAVCCVVIVYRAHNNYKGAI